MPSIRRVVLDDRLLIERLLVGLDDDGIELFTTSYWYYRACRAAVAGAGGQLSGPFEQLGELEQQQGILSLLVVPTEVGLPDPRATVPAIARLALDHPMLNLMNLEAVAAAQTIGATIWLSPPAAAGVLPPVLDATGVAWTTVTPGVGVPAAKDDRHSRRSVTGSGDRPTKR